MGLQEVCVDFCPSCLCSVSAAVLSSAVPTNINCILSPPCCLLYCLVVACRARQSKETVMQGQKQQRRRFPTSTKHLWYIEAGMGCILVARAMGISKAFC